MFFKKSPAKPLSITTPNKPSIIQHGNEDLLESVKDYTLCRESKLRSLVSLSKEVAKKQLEGDFVECGVYKGGSAALVGHFLPATANLWLYDSFEGMPQVSDKDGPDAGQWVGQCVGSEQNVREVMSKTGIPQERLFIRKGLFQDTFVNPLPVKIQFLHIDADWYDSVSLALKVFYERVVDGGVVILDDFGHWEGCREAFYDFCQQSGIKPLLNRFENDQAFWFKGQQHHRDGWVHTVQ